MARQAQRRPTRFGTRQIRTILAACAAVCLLPTVAASAATPPPLTQFGEHGDGAGQLGYSLAIVANPDTGHLYVTDSLDGGLSKRITEFTAWGKFVKAWGWGVRDGSPELQTCGPGATPPSADCLPGLGGDGAGQFRNATGIDIDSTGNVYVYERGPSGNARVQKFSSEGQFLLMFGGEVNETTGADICTQADLEAGDVCGSGTVGSGNSYFSLKNEARAGDNIAVGPDGTVFVGDTDRIQAFEPSGAFKYVISLPEPGAADRLDVDPASGDVYFTYFQKTAVEGPSQQPNVYRLDPLSGAVIDELSVQRPRDIAVDPAGNVYVANELPTAKGEVLLFDPNGTALIAQGTEFATPKGNYGDGTNPRINSLTTNPVTASGGVDLYVASGSQRGAEYVAIYGPAPDKWPPPVVPPEINSQYAVGVGTEDAVLKAEINPLFWADTSYFVEYGTSPCAEEGCTQMPASPGLDLGAGIVSENVTTPGISLQGLEPATTYYFRFVASSGGGGPTIGMGTDQREGTFHTFARPDAPNSNCPNQAFRVGISASLPDCRAYEMVSPVDKNGGDIVVQCNMGCSPARLDQAAAAGGKMTFSASAAFAGAQSSSYSNQYLARRTTAGWATQAINPVREGVPSQPTLPLDSTFRAFSDDLANGWFLHFTQPQLDPQGIAGFTNLYRRDNETSSYEALTRVVPPDATKENFLPEIQGLSANHSHVVFRAEGKLAENAKGKELMQVYEYVGGQLRLVSVRPNGLASNFPSSLGMGASGLVDDGRRAQVSNAISEDGSRIFWTEAQGGPGRVYVRIDGTETVLVSDEPAEFVTATPDGSRALLRRQGGPLVEFDVDSEQEAVIAPSALGVAGASEDLSRIYFVSTEALAGGAVPDDNNLYLYDRVAGTIFIAALPEADLSRGPVEVIYNPISPRPDFRASRVSADGNALLFMSSASLTGYDSTDAVSGEPDTEVFRYDAGAGELLCVSCHPSGERPSGVAIKTRGGTQTSIWAAAQIPAWETQLFAPRALSANGNRVFFESYEGLVLRDTNGKRDVYQWQAPGSGDCREQSPSFSPGNGGCVDLISSGESPADAEFLDASADGSEVFFTTSSSLVSQDPGLIDVYSARIEGGFPAPPEPPPSCEGEACQGPLVPPNDPTPASSAFEGAGNVKPAARTRTSCPKGKRRAQRAGKSRCVSKKASKKSQRKASKKSKSSKRGGSR